MSDIFDQMKMIQHWTGAAVIFHVLSRSLTMHCNGWKKDNSCAPNRIKPDDLKIVVVIVFVIVLVIVFV